MTRTPESAPRVTATPAAIRACFVKYQNGDCKVPNCPHDHSNAAMKYLTDKGNFWSNLNKLDDQYEETDTFDHEDYGTPDDLRMLREIESDDLDAIRDALGILTNGPVGSPIVSGRVILSDSHYWEVSEILLDTGALQRNYIDPDVLADIEIKLNDSGEYDSLPKRRRMNAAVKLDDNATVKRINEYVILIISIPNAQGNLSVSREILQVFRTGHPIIIGLPSICRSFIKPLVDGLTGKFGQIGDLVTSNANLLTLSSEADSDEVLITEGIYEPFENTLEVAPEELDFDQPHSFSFATDFLDRGMN